MTASLLVELRTEELPPKQLASLASQFAKALHASLVYAGLASDEAPLESYCSPRRLAAVIGAVAGRTFGRQRLVRGPQLSLCRDRAGLPTDALRGFLRRHGRTEDNLLTISSKGQEYVGLEIVQRVQTLSELLPAIVEKAGSSLVVPRLMRWGNESSLRFVRPVRGIMLRHGSRLIKGTVFGLPARGSTAGHRVMAPGLHAVPDAARYEQTLQAKHQVIVGLDSRRTLIKEQLAMRADEHAVRADFDEALIEEVAAMCEHPTVYVGGFDERFLTLPPEVVAVCMKRHMRCFPTYADASQAHLANSYLLVADNRPGNPSRMVAGFDRVMAARLADALFFFETDQRRSAADLGTAMARISYHPKLGSQVERIERITQLCGAMVSKSGLDDNRHRNDLVGLAAAHCKLDLPTLMISEFPELEGVMAAHYFLAREECAGLDQTGAMREKVQEDKHQIHELIAKHMDAKYDTQGNSYHNHLVIACELERLTGLLFAGEKLTGDKDPHGMRRSATRVATILACEDKYSLSSIVATAVKVIGELLLSVNKNNCLRLPREVEQELKVIILQRAKHQPQTIFNLDAVPSKRVLNAVFRALLTQAETDIRLNLVALRLLAVRDFETRPECARLIEANKRAVNIMRKAGFSANSGDRADRSRLFEPDEERLARFLDRVAGRIPVAGAKYLDYLMDLAKGISCVEDFFETVLVNVDDAIVRENRLLLLHELHEALCFVGDLAELSK